MSNMNIINASTIYMYIANPSRVVMGEIVKALREVITDAWLSRAPKRLVAEFLGS